MEPPVSPSSDPRPSKPVGPRDKIRHFPPEAQAAFHRFEKTHDPKALDSVIFAILDDFIPTKSVQPMAELPGTTRLVDDLGFDSLAITEVVFFTEELLGISIANDEILQARTLDDLRGFVRAKVSPPPSFPAAAAFTPAS